MACPWRTYPALTFFNFDALMSQSVCDVCLYTDNACMQCAVINVSIPHWRVTTFDVVVQSRFAETLTVTLTLNPNFGESGRHRHTDVVLIFSTCVCLWPLCNLSLPRNVSRERVTTVWLKFYSRLYCQKEQTSIANIQSYRTRTINLARVWITPYLSVHFDIPFTCGRVGVTRVSGSAFVPSLY